MNPDKNQLAVRVKKTLDSLREYKSQQKELSPYKDAWQLSSRSIRNYDKYSIENDKWLLSKSLNSHELRVMAHPVEVRHEIVRKMEHLCRQDTKYGPLEIGVLTSFFRLLRHPDSELAHTSDDRLVITNNSITSFDKPYQVRYMDSTDTNKTQFSAYAQEIKIPKLDILIHHHFVFNNTRYIYEKFLVKSNTWIANKFSPSIMEDTNLQRIIALGKISSLPDVVKDYLILG